MTEDRVTWVKNSSYEMKRLDEIVATKGAHLESLGGDRWFISFVHGDGSVTKIWFRSRSLNKPLIEERIKR